MADRRAELDQWFDVLEQSGERAQHEIARGARLILRTIEAAPASDYRDMALCKLTDAVITAAVAARQPNT